MKSENEVSISESSEEEKNERQSDRFLNITKS